MRRKDEERIDNLEKRIIDLENPVLLNNGQEVRFEINENKMTGIVIDNEMIYKTKDDGSIFCHHFGNPFNYRKYSVLSNGEKYYGKSSKFEKI